MNTTTKKTSSKTPADCWYPLGTVSPVRVTAKQQHKDILSDPRRLPAVDGSLWDYTQWVHSACPHWNGIHPEWSTRSE